jgi:ATP-dependent Clp protease protease subunit
MAVDNNDKKPIIIVTKFSEESVNKYIDALDKIVDQYGSSQPIVVQIDSFGGAVYGLAILYDKIKSLSNPIITYTASKAMSAGAILLSSAASPGMRFASPEANIMVHEVQSVAWGDMKDIEDEVKLTRTLNQKWMTILAKSMGLKSHVDIRKMIKKQAIGHQIYLTATQAKSLGLVDEVLSLRLTPYYGWNIEQVRR